MQSFVVAGGLGSRVPIRSRSELREFSRPLSSVFTLPPWARIRAWARQADLPRPLSAVKASIVGGRLRVIGGRDDDQLARSEVIVKLYF